LILKTYPIVTKPRKQARGKWYTFLFKRKGRIYASCSGTTSVYTWLLGKKGHISFKTRLGKVKRMKTQNQSEQTLSNYDTTRNTKAKEKWKKEEYFNPYKEDLSPVESPIMLQEKNSLWPRVNHNRQV
jgi:hypothetical protein